MKKILALVATASLMFSCSQEVTPDLEKFPINISVGQQTRATDTTFESGDEVGIYVVNYDGSTAGSLSATGNQVDNMHFTYSNNAWAPDETIYWKDKTTAADFYAYYPYSESPNISAHPFAVATDQSAKGDFWDSDFLWGKTANVSPTSSAVPIVTNHSLSRILVDVVPGDGFAGTWGNAAVSVKICDVKTSATIDLATGVATATGENGEIVPLAAAETGTTLSYKAMMIPQVVADNSKLVVVTVDGVDYIYRKGYEFKANTEHKFTVTVNKTGGSVDMSIGEWTIDDTTNEGDAMDESVSSEKAIPNNEIWYTATAKVEPALSADFGATIVSNEWNEVTGKGVISFDGEVTLIGQEAFKSSASLNSIIIPVSVIEIGYAAFSNCTYLNNIHLPNSITKMANSVFWGCTSLTSITFPESVTEIGNSLFSGCTSLKEVYITDLAKWCNIDFLNSNTNPLYFGAKLYLNGLLVENLVIPDGVEKIYRYAFGGCSSITSVTIPDSVTEIGELAFYKCPLTAVIIPNSVNEIGNQVFQDCTSLKSADISSGMTKISPSLFQGCSSLEIVNIPDSVKKICGHAFSGCSSLNEIIIPEGVSEIWMWAFNGCTSLTSVIIPSSVTSVESYAFDGCSSLTTAYIKNTTPPSAGNIFNYNTINKIYVPADSVEDYKSADGWDFYAEKIEGYDFV